MKIPTLSGMTQTRCLYLVSSSVKSRFFLQPALTAVSPLFRSNNCLKIPLCVRAGFPLDMAKPGSSNWANAGGEGPCRMLALTGWNHRRLFIVTLTPGCGFQTTRRLFRRSRKFSRAEPMLIRLAGAAGGVYQDDKVGQLTFSGSRV